MRSAVVDLASQPVTNGSWDPRATRWSIQEGKQPSFWGNRWGTFTSYSLVTGASDGPPGGITTYARLTTTGTQAGLGFHLAENPEVANPLGQILAPAAPSETVTLSLWVRCSAAVTINLTFRPGSNNTWIGASSSTGTALAAGVWQRITKTYKAPAGSTGLGIYAVFASTVPVGTTLDATGMVYTRGGVHPSIFCDGALPGWRWLGAAGVSPSVGYPYTLDSIAGAPAVDLLGNVSGSLGTMGETDARTLYAVHDVLTVSSAIAGQVARFGPSDGSARRVRLRYDGNGDFGAQYFESGGSSLLAEAVFPGARTLGRHVASLQVPTGFEAFSVTLDGSSEITTATPAAKRSLPNSDVVAHSDSGSSPVRLVAYRSAHSLETRRRITAWLARQYGSPIPSGY